MRENTNDEVFRTPDTRPSSLIPVSRADAVTRFWTRAFEAIEIATNAEARHHVPAWVVNVISKLREQLLPVDFEEWSESDVGVWLEGLAFAILPELEHFQGGKRALWTFLESPQGQSFFSAEKRDVVRKLTTGEWKETLGPDLERGLCARIFRGSRRERIAFAEGLRTGVLLLDLQDQSTAKQTDATVWYFLLWMNWPEISKMRSYTEIYSALAPFFDGNSNLLGSGQERLRKILYRAGLRSRRNSPERSIPSNGRSPE